MSDEKKDAPKAEEKKDAAPAAKKATEFVIKHGSLIIGKSEKRSKGETVKAAELSKKELAALIADGTLAEL